MAQVFHRALNPFARFTLFGGAFLVAGLAWVSGALYRSSWVTRAEVVRDQPVPFTHELHAGRLALDCRYCHTTVETGPFAGIPPTATCMGCHSQIWADSPMLAPVRESFRTGRPIEWTRVHDIADFAYFDHSVHVARGVGCVTCHGHVDRMPLMWQEQPLSMEWCLGCHRAPERHLRPREAVFDAEWTPSGPQDQIGARLVRDLGIRPGTSCSNCHH